MSRVQPAAATRPNRPAETPAADGENKGRGRPKADKKPYREDENAPKLDAWPDDFDPKKHKPLTVEDFNAEDVYWNRKAEQYDKKASDCRLKADLFQKYGSSENRKSAEKATKLADQLGSLLSELESDDVDTSDLLAGLMAKMGVSEDAPAAE